ncbi:hypothetical protein N7540_010022 [Penicillium herquei]|nr:hypothetical protein N7540_010022 [Penicillium herquei]
MDICSKGEGKDGIIVVYLLAGLSAAPPRPLLSRDWQDRWHYDAKKGSDRASVVMADAKPSSLHMSLRSMDSSVLSSP